MNNVIIVIEMVVVFSSLLLCKKIFGRNGVIAWVPIATILANIITAKNAEIIGLSTAIGTVMFASTFLATDILSECYSIDDAKIAVKLGLFSNILLVLATQIALAYKPSAIDFVDSAMRTLFNLNLRISISSAVMYYFANMADIYVYNRIKTATHNEDLWLRNNVSTMLCNCLENFGFIGIAFAGIYDFQTIVHVAISTSIIEIAVALCDTPFLYIARNIRGGNKV